MKTSKLTKTALAVVVAAQLLSVEAFAGTVKVTNLTTNKMAIQDPYFQLSKPSITEVTEEEALEFINDSSLGLTVKNVTIPNIPPRPPEEKKCG